MTLKKVLQQFSLLITLWNMKSALFEQSHITDPALSRRTQTLMCCSTWLGLIVIKQIWTLTLVKQCCIALWSGILDTFCVESATEHLWMLAETNWNQVPKTVSHYPTIVMEQFEICVESITFFPPLKSSKLFCVERKQITDCVCVLWMIVAAWACVCVYTRVTHCSASSSGHLPAKICKGRCEIRSSGNHPGIHHSRWQLVLVHLNDT